MSHPTAYELACLCMQARKQASATSGALLGGLGGAGLLGAISAMRGEDRRRTLVNALLGAGLGAGVGGSLGHFSNVGGGNPIAGLKRDLAESRPEGAVVITPKGEISRATLEGEPLQGQPSLRRDVLLSGASGLGAGAGYLGGRAVRNQFAKVRGTGGAVGRLAGLGAQYLIPSGIAVAQGTKAYNAWTR